MELLFAKEDVVPITPRESPQSGGSSGLGALLQKELTPPPTPFTSAQIPRKINLAEELQLYMTDEKWISPYSGIPDHASFGDEEELPFTCKIWLPARHGGTRRTVVVTVMQPLSIQQLLQAVISQTRSSQAEHKDSLQEILPQVVLVAATPMGEFDDDCPALDSRLSIHRFGIDNFLLTAPSTPLPGILLPITRAGMSSWAFTTSVLTVGSPNTSPILNGAFDPDFRLLEAAEMGNLGVVQYLLEHSLAKLHALGIDNLTALHYAARKGQYPVVRYLLRSGADPNAKTKNGWTCLHLAVYHGHLDIAELILIHGADPEIVDSLNRNPLSYAHEKNDGSAQRRKMVEILESH